MKKPFTLRIEENLIESIKLDSIKKGYSSYSDYIQHLLLVGQAFECMRAMKIKDSNYSLLSDDTIDSLDDFVDFIKERKNID